eukprot:774731-Prymnesium_polylepis.1
MNALRPPRAVFGELVVAATILAVAVAEPHDAAYAVLAEQLGELQDRGLDCDSSWQSLEVVRVGNSSVAASENACGDRALHEGDKAVVGAFRLHTADQHIYHEMLVHSALVAFTAIHVRPPRTVFLGGGGDGGSAREILKWSSVEA